MQVHMLLPKTALLLSRSLSKTVCMEDVHGHPARSCAVLCSSYLGWAARTYHSLSKELAKKLQQNPTQTF